MFNVLKSYLSLILSVIQSGLCNNACIDFFVCFFCAYVAAVVEQFSIENYCRRHDFFYHLFSHSPLVVSPALTGIHYASGHYNKA